MLELDPYAAAHSVADEIRRQLEDLLAEGVRLNRDSAILAVNCLDRMIRLHDDELRRSNARRGDEARRSNAHRQFQVKPP